MEDYKYIQAWGKMLGSFPDYIEREVRKAIKDNAPPTAIYRKQDRAWITFEDVQREDTRRTIRAILQSM